MSTRTTLLVVYSSWQGSRHEMTILCGPADCRQSAIGSSVALLYEYFMSNLRAALYEYELGT